jgi:TRAP-type uncharacterized transport system substrate-binding protein
MTERKRRWRWPLILPVVAVLVLVTGGAWSFVSRGIPPRTVKLATGPPGSSNAELGERYRAALARSGIDLQLVSTAGDVENLARLRDPHSGVSAGFVMAGLPGASEASELETLGTISYEPVWVFERTSATSLTIEGVAGKRMSIGPEGSGTRVMAQRVMAMAGIDTHGSSVVDLPPHDAAERLLRGDLDVLVLVGSWDSPLVRKLVAAPDVSLVNFRRADAFVALNPELTKLVLPMGVGDLRANRPPADVLLIAPKGSLVVRSDLHDAIQYLLLDAAAQIHARPGIFQRAGLFPAAEAIDFPLSDEAARYHKAGRPFLYRYLPFWMAVLSERLLVLLIPLVGLVLPLARILPNAYRNLVQGRILALYGELKLLETELERNDGSQSTADLIARLDALERRAGRLRVPRPYFQALYTLRTHIGLVHDRLVSRA